VAFLAGSVSKRLLFSGGALAIAGTPDAAVDTLVTARSGRAQIAWQAYIESAVKAVAALAAIAPAATTGVRAGRRAGGPRARDELTACLHALRSDIDVRALTGFAATAKAAAQGAALVADGLAGGRAAALVDALGIRDARSTVLDHLYVIDQSAARA